MFNTSFLTRELGHFDKDFVKKHQKKRPLFHQDTLKTTL